MKRTRTILLLTGVLAVLLAQVYRHAVPQDVFTDELPPAAELSSTDNLPPAIDLPPVFDLALATKPAFDVQPPTNLPPVNPLAVGPLQANPMGATFPEEQSLYDRMLSIIDPESLRKYEGSYTRGDLRSKGDQSQSFKLESSWLIGGSKIPQAGVLMRKNPQTGQYEFSGGEILVPGRGVGISHESDEKTGERRTFLNLKKEF